MLRGVVRRAAIVSRYRDLDVLVVQHSGKMLVFDRRTFPVVHLTNSWTGDHFVGKLSTMGQLTQPPQPFILPGSINE